MEGTFGVPFHFAVEFLVLVVSLGAAFDAVRARRHGAGRWSLVQATGFLMLAAAQGLHGSLTAQEDGGVVVLAVRTLAFAILAASARPAAALSAAPADLPVSSGGAYAALFLPGAEARWAFVPGVAALLVAVRGIRAHRADQDPSTFAFAAAFISFAIAEGAVALASSAGGVAFLVAHIARGLGALLLARWLGTSIVRSVRRRFVASFVGVLTIGVLVIAVALNVVIARTLEREELRRLADAATSRVTTMQSLGETAGGSAGLIAKANAFRDAIKARDPKASLGDVVNLFKLDLLALVDGRGRIFSSAQRIDKKLYRLSTSEKIGLQGTPVVGESLTTGEPTQSAVPLVSSSGGVVRDQIVVLASAPVVERGRVLGAVLAGFRMDVAFLRGVRFDTSAEATLLSGDRIAGTTFSDADQVKAAFAGLGAELREVREEGGELRRLLTIGGSEYVTAFVPITASNNDVIGGLVLSRQALALAAAQRAITRTLFLVTLLAVMLAALLAWVSGGRITRPLRALTAAARELRGGNLDARTRIRSTDEVGTLGTAFNEMAEELQRKAEELGTSAATEADLRARIEAILQSMSDGLIAVDSRGIVGTVNRAAEQIIGRKAEKVIGKPVQDVLVGRAIDGNMLVDYAMLGGSIEGAVHRDRGGTVPVALTAAPLLDASGQGIGRVIVLRDVSRERQVERMKSEFLSNVSHELRTPITPIKGYAQILRHKKFPREKTEDFLEGIIASTERLERIVEILVDFSSMEAGKLKPRAEALEVRSLLDGAVARWRPKAGSRLVRKAAADLPPILGDQKMLNRSLDELLDNAVKFSPSGGRIEISAEASVNGSRSKPSKIVITVRDNGIGIEKERMGDLFQDFRQLDGSDTRSFGGLGLGLAYVKRIANALGGDVSVESKAGRGSAFSIVLPVADTKAEVAATAAAPARHRALDANGRRTTSERARGWADRSVKAERSKRTPTPASGTARKGRKR